MGLCDLDYIGNGFGLRFYISVIRIITDKDMDDARRIWYNCRTLVLMERSKTDLRHYVQCYAHATLNTDQFPAHCSVQFYTVQESTVNLWVF